MASKWPERNRRAVFSRRHGLARDDLAEHRLGSRSGIRRLTHEHFIKHGAQGIRVGCRPDGLIARRLFGRHVVRSPKTQAGLR